MTDGLRKPVWLKAIGYFFTGGMAAVVDLGGFLAFVQAGLPVVPASTLSFFLACIVNYAASATFVFNARIGLGAFAKFLSGAVAGWIVNVGITTILTYYTSSPLWAAKLAAIAVAFCANLVINIVFVFGGEPRADDASMRTDDTRHP